MQCKAPDLDELAGAEEFLMGGDQCPFRQLRQEESSPQGCQMRSRHTVLSAMQPVIDIMSVACMHACMCACVRAKAWILKVDLGEK
jgi:hypothetical protein